MITKESFTVDHASLQDKTLLFEFAKETYSDEKAPGNKSTRDRSLRRLL